MRSTIPLRVTHDKNIIYFHVPMLLDHQMIVKSPISGFCFAYDDCSLSPMLMLQRKSNVDNKQCTRGLWFHPLIVYLMIGE
jgi:hypothetical protein